MIDLFSWRGIRLMLLLLGIALWSCDSRKGDPKVLVFSKTDGFYHSSIPEGVKAIQLLGEQNGFEVDTTSDANRFREELLKEYSAVVFLNTTGDVLNHYQQADFERYIQAGGGFVGIHAATDTEYDWPWYGELVGAYFEDHPGINDPHPGVQAATLIVEDNNHPSTSFLPEKWERKDEWYSFKNFNASVNVLLSIDEETYQGGVKMGKHPMAWYHEYDGGRAFYTSGGHTRESYEEELFLRHLLEGIRYAIGGNKKLNYSKAVSKRVPEADRFEKKMLVYGEFVEPTEMTILPNKDVLIAQRRGEILLYKSTDSTLTEAAKLDVYWKTDVPRVNAEEGVMGLKADPNFAENKYVYAFYSPKEEWVNRLSRFKFEDDQLKLETEQVILEFYSQRDICCHTGGSIAFDRDGLLYLSTGDNATPFNQPQGPHRLTGYAPIDDRPGYEQYDAARSSGNTNDLRGKILRIKVNEDGSYDIPDGNLYAQGMEKAKPEIYVQGTRNPYRISVDQKTGYLYWGEVGPDARADSMKVRGPKGYDEINQARKAGFFGWPFFVGDNYPYTSFDFDEGKSGITFDSQNPVNISRNNTGLSELPPAQPAFIWYPYDRSEEFPQVGTGGRNAMAGPVYYSDLYENGGGLPDYFDGKLFIYEWIRGWIKVVSMDENGNYKKMEPFMEDVKHNALIDMELGPDGTLYLLEYGNGWFNANPDAGLSIIQYNPGNRAPLVTSLEVDETSGALPFTVNVSAEVKDPENDPLIFVWDMGNGEIIESKEPQISYTYKEVGDYDITLTVTDPGKLSATSQPLNVYAGNIAPKVQINILGNQTFYFPGVDVRYEVAIRDEDDPEAGEDLSTLYVSADYIEGFDRAEANLGHQVMSEAMTGKSIMESLTCKTCHNLAEPSVGPAYTEVAKKYSGDGNAPTHLVNKIIKGGSGVWGETMMPANPDLKTADAKRIVAYIMSLDGMDDQEPSLPARGSVSPTLDKAAVEDGVFTLSASFTDRGGEDGVKPLSGAATHYLRSGRILMDEVSGMEGFANMDLDQGRILITDLGEQSHFYLENIDLRGIRSIQVHLGAQRALDVGYSIEARLGSPSGELIAQMVLRNKETQGIEEGFNSSVDLKLADEIQRREDIYFVLRPLNAEESSPLSISRLVFSR